VVLSAEGDWEGIINATDEFLSKDSTDYGALSYRALALCHLEKYESCLECLNQILKADEGGKYHQYFKIRVLVKLGEVLKAYEFFKSLEDSRPNQKALGILAHALIDIGEFEKALDCLDILDGTNWIFSYRIIDGYKRIENLSGMKLSGRYDRKYYMSWIAQIESTIEDNFCPLCGVRYDNQFSMCGTCSEGNLMIPYGTPVECDHIKMYYYICDKLRTLKKFLKEHASLENLHKEMDCLDDEEFNAFISHLKSIGYIVEASKGYIWDSEVMKPYCDEGKYVAPRWLAFPGYSPNTIGWRMGAGEDYCMNEPVREREFYELFPKPKNWLFNPRNPKFEDLGKMPFLSAIWDDGLNPKYSEISSDAITANDFITMDMEGEFRVDALHFHSIEHAILFSKIASYNRLDPYRVTFDELKNDFTISDDDLRVWNRFRYMVCLNATYYRFMQDDELKHKLLATGDNPIVYISDDEWGGEENLFGFALMQVRDEINRLCEHENLIDWRYTEYVKNAYPYISHRRDINDQQSAEYRVVESTLSSSSRYVRDVNLADELASKYEAGQILTEKAFVDASSRIGGMVTSHRYLILSQFMLDLSSFEEKTNWGINVANCGSRYKVLDIFTVDGKTQILLLHLPNGFEGVFDDKRDVEDEFIQRERENFKKDLKKDPIEDLASDEWLERCSFPVGMSDEGEFY
jgi:hypothetical protein